MPYTEQAALYADADTRARATSCIRQQALIFASDSSASIASLGRAVVGGSMPDIDSLIAAVTVGPSWQALAEDDALLGAVREAWPVVAAARFPQKAVE